MFIKSLFTITPKWKQGKCPSAIEEIKYGISTYNKKQFINKREQNTAIKKKMNLENTVK